MYMYVKFITVNVKFHRNTFLNKQQNIPNFLRYPYVISIAIVRHVTNVQCIIFDFCDTDDHEYVLFVVVTIHPPFSLMTYHRILNNNSTTSATSGAGAAYPSGESEFIPGF